MNLRFRPATRDDLPVLLEIEQECFSHPHWKEKDFLEDDCQVAELDGAIAGFLVSNQTFHGDADSAGEREILNLAVRPCFRRMGIASALLKQQLAHRATLFLEVRASNQAAQALYHQFGFVEIGRRHGYYQAPEETAIVMRMKWC